MQDKLRMITGTRCETRLLRLCKLLTVLSQPRGRAGAGREELPEEVIAGYTEGVKDPIP